MADYRKVDAQRSGSDGLRQVLTSVRDVAGAIDNPEKGQLDRDLFSMLHNAMLDPNASAAREVVRVALDSGTRASDLADHYFPKLARNYGQMWCDDELSFAQVTIAVSRLQSALRDLEARWDCANTETAQSATLLLIIPKDAVHTLGAFVLSGQLRRKGISVKMLLDGTAKSVVDQLQRSAFDTIFISASQSETLESLRFMIDAVKAVAEDAPPIVVGGAILDVETASAVMASTGADYATGIPEEALEYCGLLRITQDDTTTKYRG